MPSFTPEQSRAIDARGGDLLVSAAAGSGKTTVLIERVLSLVASGTDVDRILIVTFTRAAAADMRAKLEKRLEERAQTDARMREQLDRLPSAAIGTLHSFCSALIREQFEAAGVDPAFRIMEGAEGERIASRALREAMEEVYSRGGEGLSGLLCGRDTANVGELAMELYAYSRNRPDPMGWLEDAVSSLSRDGHIEELYSDLEADARSAVREAVSILRAAFDVCCLADGPEHYAAGIQNDMDLLMSLCEGLPPGALAKSLGEFRATRPGRGKCDADLLEAVKSLRDKAVKRVKDAAQTLVPFEDAKRDMALLRGPAQTLFEIVRGLHERIEAEKDERGAYDYSDLEHRALRALSDFQAGEAARAKYDYVFVDEYQDVSDAQESVIRLVAKPGRLFLVGDVKQSIYRFRHAEPGLFLEKARRFREGEGGELIALNRNFRSRAAILRFTNLVFERVFTGEGSEIEYGEGEYLVPAASFAGEDPPVELMLLETKKASAEENGGEEEADRDAARAEGLFIARRIRELVGTPLYDPALGEFRPLAYRDIVVLARTRARILEIRDALDRRGVPCYADASGGLADSMEVRHALALLSLVENRRRDTDLLAALLGPGMGFTPEDVALIRVREKEGSLLDAALACAGLSPGMGESGDAVPDAPVEDGLSVRLRAFFERLGRWRLLSRNLALDEFVNLLLAETGFYAYAGYLPGGVRRQANLDLLCDLAAKYADSHSDGLRGFLESFRPGRGGSDYGEASALGEGDDVVRVMTTHKSKGLEFPVVFGAQLERDFTRINAKSELRVSKDAGFGLEIHDPVLHSRRRTLLCMAVDSRSRLEAINEELRLLYVLMTRASDRLILVGRVKDEKSERLRWRASPSGIRGIRTALDALALAVPGFSETAPADAPVALSVAPDSALSAGRIESAEPDTAVSADIELERLFAEAFSWRYPYSGETASPVKLTVTGLTRRMIGPAVRERPNELPDFLGGDRAALERGTAIHAALSVLSLAPLRGLSGFDLREELRLQLDALMDKGLLSGEERASADAETLARFFEGDIGRRLLAAKEPRREWQFNLCASAGDAIATAAPDARMLIQGVIDCCFLEEGGWVLLDYKTDFARDEQALLERYGPQLRLYKRALEEITGTPVSQAWLCLLRKEKALPVV